MRNSSRSAHVKGDYLIQLACKWCRIDTNWARFDAFVAPLGRKAPFEGEKRLDRLSRAHFVASLAVDDHLAGTRSGVVVGAHRHRVGAGREDRDEIAGCYGEGAVDSEDIARLAHGADDVVR